MNSILVGDAFVLMREYNDLSYVGNLYEVANIVNDSVVVRDGYTKVAVGVIPIVDFEKYFKPKEKKSWTDWTPILTFNDDEPNLFYKTNRKRVKIKDLSGVKSESCCHKDDEFNLYKGIQIALLRYNIKRAVSKVQNMLELGAEIDDYDTLLKRLESGKE